MSRRRTTEAEKTSEKSGAAPGGELMTQLFWSFTFRSLVAVVHYRRLPVQELVSDYYSTHA